MQRQKERRNAKCLPHRLHQCMFLTLNIFRFVHKIFDIEETKI